MNVYLRTLLFYLLLVFAPLAQAVQPLPSHLIDLSSDQGWHYLKTNANENTVKMLSHFTTQNTTTYCGVASVVMVLNSSKLEKPADPDHKPYHYFTQDAFFTDAVKKIISPEVVKDNGITLDQLAQITNTFGLHAQAFHANHIKNFSKLLKDALDNQQFVIANFSRQAMGQEGGGHHSPVVAYTHRHGEDWFLMLDVARYKYPAYWVKAQDLWAAVNTEDKDANAYRGVLVISG
jgi:hypothetical protein